MFLFGRRDILLRLSFGGLFIEASAKLNNSNTILFTCQPLKWKPLKKILNYTRGHGELSNEYKLSKIRSFLEED